ncbi:hypothetical protein AcW1_004212 [Taiwanofungus camphoratus]|nr:hypothetical protein AcW2_006773 [Antrodia cinnamomea]KAI0939079.1 hypothetical protein AcV5_000594 [Antrodia cinnamomea]KAI0951997.1 hypothetical protein AcV7_007934 [Antrodia cinnamomea]KAI0959369.1 hypothetical protein AcW1_004212 [Antrodia cinnamomea]
MCQGDACTWFESSEPADRDQVHTSRFIWRSTMIMSNRWVGWASDMFAAGAVYGSPAIEIPAKLNVTKAGSNPYLQLPSRFWEDASYLMRKIIHVTFTFQ